MELSFKQWLEDVEIPPDDGGLAYKKPEIANEKSAASKKICRLFGKEKQESTPDLLVGSKAKKASYQKR